MTNRRDPYWQQEARTPRWAWVVAGLILLAGIGVSVGIVASDGNSGSRVATTVAKPAGQRQAAKVPQHQPETRTYLPPASGTSQKEAEGGGNGGGFLGPGADASFASLAASLSAQVGLAVAPLAGGEVREFGDLRSGHAWSTMKVPILTTLMREQGETLNAEEEAWASSALTASDNDAAASLFGQLEAMDGGLAGASQAVEATLRASGDAETVVATAPPPPGAISTWGQTEWSLSGSIQFYGALAGGCLLGSSATQYVTGLMESVISEQRWGLGEASFPSGWRVGFKGGWGPESGGGYLVRQSGFIRDGSRGLAVAMMASDDSGSYPAGAADLSRMAQWLAGQLNGLGPAGSRC